MKKLSLFIVSLLLITACDKQHLERQKTNNEQYHMDLLFEKDGCKFYRFQDGHDVYWTDCRGKIQSSYSTGGKHQHTVYVENITE